MQNWNLADPTMEDREEALAFAREYLDAAKEDDHIQGACGLEHTLEGMEYADWLAYIGRYAKGEGLPEGHVHSNTYFLRDGQTPRVYGIVSIRWQLTQALLQHAGHIGYCIRPCERRKGLGSLQLGLALAKCREAGIEKALLTCLADNLGSAATILSQGGVEDIPYADEDGSLFRRFWIPTGTRLVLRKGQDVEKALAMQALAEFTAVGDSRIYGSSGIGRMSYDQWVEKLRRNSDGINLLEGHVPQDTCLSLLLPERIPVGFIGIRNRLTSEMEMSVGHIGYSICPSQRQKGYGKRQLRLALSYLQSAGVVQAIVTCAIENIASAATAQSCGGVEAESAHTEEGIVRRFYLPTLPKQI